jgi:hypothetical protein
MRLSCFIFFCILLALVSCKKDAVIPPPDLGYNYYPGTIKSYVIYDVDSISYRQVQGDTLKYKFQIQEVMDTLITDNENRPTIKLIRYRKNYSATIPYSQMTWTLQSVWVANKTTTSVQEVEQNLRYTKLAFPVNVNATWNGTAFADTSQPASLYTNVDVPVAAGGNTFTYAAVDVLLMLNGNTFNKTLTVSQFYNANALTYQNYYEQYARGVGLVYKHIENYVYAQSGGVAQQGIIAGGLYYTMTVNSYGGQ